MSTNPSAFGNAPTGPAGGSLVGTYPNPTFSQAASPIWLPADNGLLAATAGLDGGGSQTPALTAGTLYLQKLYIRSAFTITNIWYITTVAGAGASTGSFVGVYNSSGTLLSGSADIGANLIAAVNNFNTALTTPQAVTSGFVWLAFLVNLATTQPQMRTEATTSFATVNLGLTVATARSATSSTGVTALPASITPASNVFSGTTIWLGVS